MRISDWSSDVCSSELLQPADQLRVSERHWPIRNTPRRPFVPSVARGAMYRGTLEGARVARYTALRVALATGGMPGRAGHRSLQQSRNRFDQLARVLQQGLQQDRKSTRLNSS